MSENTCLVRGAAKLAKALKEERWSAVDREFERFVRKYGPLRIKSHPHYPYAGREMWSITEVRVIAFANPHDGVQERVVGTNGLTVIVELVNGVERDLARMIVAGELLPE